MECLFRVVVEKQQYHPGGTAFRIEAFEPSDRCYMKPKRNDIDPGRWILSGGDAASVLYPCGPCPLKVIGEDALMNNGKSAPCPACGTFNRRLGYGEIICRECGTVFEIIAQAKPEEVRK